LAEKVLGYNHRNSANSRVYDFVPRHELKNKATTVVFSVDYNNNYLAKNGRFLKDINSI